MKPSLSHVKATFFTISPFQIIQGNEVIEIGTNRKPVCDFLLVINSNIMSCTVWELSSLIVQILHTLHFLSPLGKTYDVLLGLTGRRAVDFILVLIELFRLGVTAEALTIEKRSKISDFAPTQSL